ncbi:subtilisin-like serine protease precursor [Encephalitozoon romaleae SJ-2008]|uniref:Subtilisin-like serine protease n=1 Tax=Encephalitozoon romaleae (strain SJ-2008) TaxID=1178016 RepID=I7ALA7_ENCRO|nr:subtilisin-like serine protease precursor [Encephalitozoon romaleae SJ-2008]AFN82439.1 subtilisin-like serine protease precursor [Encephalitozoon romaleae SJ-2008]
MILAITFLSLVLCRERSDYIVMFDQDPSMDKGSMNALYSMNILKAQSILEPDESIEIKITNGFVARMTKSTAEKMKRHPNVKMVVRDTPVGISGLKIGTSYNNSGEGILIQRHAPWGLSRIVGSVSFASGSYYYPMNSGEGVDVYVLDTGIEVSHPEFEGRARWGANFVAESLNEDEHGHGTHCAGVIGGKNFGISKKSSIIAVKVLDRYGSGMTSRLLQGLDFVIKEHEKKKDELYNAAANEYLDSTRSSDIDIEIDDSESFSFLQSKVPSVQRLVDTISEKALEPKTIINLSVGGFRNPALNFAIEYASRLGIHFSTAAGNEHEDACDFSPGSSKASITTGASTYKDTVAFFSNFGECVNIFAPGVDILSSWIGGTQKIVSGTSMAAPHTTGVMAAYLTYYDYDPHTLKKRIINDARIVEESSGNSRNDNIPWPFPALFNSNRRKLPMLSMENLLKRIKNKI